MKKSLAQRARAKSSRGADGGASKVLSFSKITSALLDVGFNIETIYLVASSVKVLMVTTGVYRHPLLVIIPDRYHVSMDDYSETAVPIIEMKQVPVPSDVSSRMSESTFPHGIGVLTELTVYTSGRGGGEVVAYSSAHALAGSETESHLGAAVEKAEDLLSRIDASPGGRFEDDSALSAQKIIRPLVPDDNIELVFEDEAAALAEAQTTSERGHPEVETDPQFEYGVEYACVNLTTLYGFLKSDDEESLFEFETQVDEYYASKADDENSQRKDIAIKIEAGLSVLIKIVSIFEADISAKEDYMTDSINRLTKFVDSSAEKLAEIEVNPRRYKPGLAEELQSRKEESVVAIREAIAERRRIRTDAMIWLSGMDETINELLEAAPKVNLTLGEGDHLGSGTLGEGEVVRPTSALPVASATAASSSESARSAEGVRL